MKALFVLLLGSLALMLSRGVLLADEGQVVIRNKYLEVRADRKTGEITILAKGKSVLHNGRISSGELAAFLGVVKLESQQGGQGIGIYHMDVQTDMVLLPNDSPFVMIITIVPKPVGAPPLLISKMPVFHAEVDLGLRVRTM